MPKPSRYQMQVVSYLNRRGIDTDIIRFCQQRGIVYESENYHNAVFVGMDKGGKSRYAALHGIGTDFIGDANGNDKNYSFSIPAEGDSAKVQLFESAIDLLSYAPCGKRTVRTGGRNTSYPLRACISQQNARISRGTDTGLYSYEQLPPARQVAGGQGAAAETYRFIDSQRYPLFYPLCIILQKTYKLYFDISIDLLSINIVVWR